MHGPAEHLVQAGRFASHRWWESCEPKKSLGKDSVPFYVSYSEDTQCLVSELQVRSQYSSGNGRPGARFGCSLILVVRTSRDVVLTIGSCIEAKWEAVRNTLGCGSWPTDSYADRQRNDAANHSRIKKPPGRKWSTRLLTHILPLTWRYSSSVAPRVLVMCHFHL